MTQSFTTAFIPGSRRGFVMLCILVLFSGCIPAQQSASAVQATNRIVYGLTFEPSGFDPHLNASSELGIPLRSVYDTLVYRDPANGQFIPGLASEWSVSPDGLVYTFQLRQGVMFHDGTAFNAQAVAANLDRITNPANASQKAIFMLGTYERYEIIDDYAIRLILSAPYSPLLDSLSQVYLGMASPTALAAFSNERYQFHQVGTGPFQFVEYIPGDRLVIRRSPTYTWNPPFYQPTTTQSVDEIEFRFFSDPSSRSIALESGDAQIMGELLPTDARLLAGRDDLTVAPVSVPGQPLQFMFNTAQFPTNDLRVRQALLFGTNRDVIVNTIFQRFSPVAWGPLAASTLYYTDQVVGAYGYDPTQARALLEAAGFADADGNGFYDASGGDLEVTLIVPGWGFVPEVAQLIQDQWRTIGVRAVLDSAPSRSLVVERVNAGAYHLVAFYSFGLDPALLNDYFVTGAVNNWMNYSNPDLDRLLIDAAAQTDPAARAASYNQAQRLIMAEALILPIRDYINLNAYSRAVAAPSFDVYGWFPILHNLALSSG